MTDQPPEPPRADNAQERAEPGYLGRDDNGPIYLAPEGPDDQPGPWHGPARMGAAMAAAGAPWWPEADNTRQRASIDGGSIVPGSGPKGLWHTTETDTWPAYASGYWPHVTVSWSAGRFLARGHVRHDRAARALRNLDGGCQTNRTGVKQVEIVTRADVVDEAGLPAVAEEGLGRYAQWCRVEWGVLLECRVRFIPYPASFGPANGVRLTCAEWWPYAGWCGHMHAAENVHGDPGRLDWLPILRPATSPPGPPPEPPPPPPTGWRVLDND